MTHFFSYFFPISIPTYYSQVDTPANRWFNLERSHFFANYPRLAMWRPEISSSAD